MTQEFLDSFIETLANDSMQGRKSGSPGIEKAAKYIEQQFSEIGLKPFNNSSFRQSFKHINSRSESKEELDLFNIIGLLEGTSLKEEFVVKRSWDGGKPHVIQSFAEARKLMAEIDSLKVVSLGKLEKGGHYQIRTEAELSKVTLPFYLHYLPLHLYLV